MKSPKQTSSVYKMFVLSFFISCLAKTVNAIVNKIPSASITDEYKFGVP